MLPCSNPAMFKRWNVQMLPFTCGAMFKFCNVQIEPDLTVARIRQYPFESVKPTASWPRSTLPHCRYLTVLPLTNLTIKMFCVVIGHPFGTHELCVFRVAQFEGTTSSQGRTKSKKKNLLSSSWGIFFSSCSSWWLFFCSLGNGKEKNHMFGRWNNY